MEKQNIPHEKNKKYRKAPDDTKKGSGVVSSMAETVQQQGRGWIASDILGSYTGTPEDGITPEQDPDDL